MQDTVGESGSGREGRARARDSESASDAQCKELRGARQRQGRTWAQGSRRMDWRASTNGRNGRTRARGGQAVGARGAEREKSVSQRAHNARASANGSPEVDRRERRVSRAGGRYRTSTRTFKRPPTTSRFPRFRYQLIFKRGRPYSFFARGLVHSPRVRGTQIVRK